VKITSFNGGGSVIGILVEPERARAGAGAGGAMMEMEACGYSDLLKPPPFASLMPMMGAGPNMTSTRFPIAGPVVSMQHEAERIGEHSRGQVCEQRRLRECKGMEGFRQNAAPSTEKYIEGGRK